MSRSFIYLRRALFGVSCAVVFGFGVTQAFAAPETAASGGSCPWSANGPYFYEPCENFCRSEGGAEWGYCENGMCVCV